MQDWHRPTPQRQNCQAEPRCGSGERTPRSAANSRAALPGQPPQSRSGAAVGSGGAHGPTRAKGSGGTARTAAAKATAPAGNYGESQDRQHTERAGQDRSGNAGNGSPQTVSVFLLLWRGLQKPVALVAAGPPPVPVCWPTLNGLREQTAPSHVELGQEQQARR